MFRFLLGRILESAPLFGGTLRLCFPIEKWGDYYGWEERWTAAKIMPPPAASSFRARLANVLLQDERDPKGGRQAGGRAARPPLSFWPNCSFQLKGENVSCDCEHFVAIQSVAHQPVTPVTRRGRRPQKILPFSERLRVRKDECRCFIQECRIISVSRLLLSRMSELLEKRIEEEESEEGASLT